MKRIAVVAFFLLLAASRSFGAPCVASPTRLCLNDGRFATEVTWKDFQGNTGPGQAISLTGDTGYFWFFSSSNVELVVKVLDGRALNASYWVFYGALSNVEYTMTVTDTVTGNVKTYVNPSGSFGSVGDTSAFPGAGSVAPASASAEKIEALSASTALALRESLLPAGATLPPQTVKRGERSSASAATPSCSATDTSLCLNSGRFQVEVEWTDFAGKTGVGTAVGLTGDTGYFWFFSSNNVELTVKVLDGRGLNGRFWVFYGALSNVQYEMTVTDTLTGNVNTYSNPSGQFASTGDTDGFRVGQAVAVTLDAVRAVSKDIPVEGGDISATAADGSVYSLHVPADALLSPQTITMTPAARIDGLPLSGGLTTAVQITPDGLSLRKAATLTIVPARQVAVAQQVTFAWRGSGEEFFLYPTAVPASPLSMAVITFAGYGTGAGTSGDVAAALQRPPARPADELSQNLEPLDSSLRSGSASGLAGKSIQAETDAITDQIETLLRNYYRQQVLPKLQSKSCSVGRKGVAEYNEWLARVDAQPNTRNPFVAEVEEGRRAVIAVSERCYNEAYQACVSKKNSDYGFVMLTYYRELQQANATALIDPFKMQRCLTFDLDFGSRIVENIDEALSFSEFTLAKAELSPPNVNSLWILVGALISPAPTCSLAVGGEFCPTTTTCDWTGFKMTKLRLQINPAISGLFNNTFPVLEYVPERTKSAVTVHITTACADENLGDVKQDISIWYLDYVFTFHQDEYEDGVLTARDWKLPRWIKEYNRSSPDGKLKEFSVLALTHKPY